MGTTTNLVLGGSGTIGTALCEFLINQGEKVINLDIKEGFDLRYQSLEQHKDVDYVWFLAWEVGGAKFLSNPEFQLQIINNNTQICVNTFQFLEKHKLPFLFVSSQLASTDNSYGITKILGETWTKVLGGKIARLWNVYGWEGPGHKSHVIPDMIIQTLTKGSITLLTNGNEERQFIYIDDCVKNLYEFKNSAHQQVHLTNGEWVSIKEIATKIAKLIPAKIELGKNNGYQNKIDPNKTHLLYSYPKTMESGLGNIIEKAQSYLKSQH